MISVQNLVKRYGDFEAVSHLSFSVEAGQTLGLLGTNGAGKSTTIQILTGQLLPTEGTVRVMGIDPSFDPKAVHQSIGYIPDQQCLYEDLSTFDNIDLFRKIHLLPPSATNEIIEKIGLSEKTKVKVKTLSKGLKQRVLIARAMMHKPKVLFLDEPTSGLDPSSANTICTFLEELKTNGTTILLTTHLMNEVDRLCDRVIFVHKGQMIEQGTPFELKMKYRKPILQLALKSDSGMAFEEHNLDTPLIFERMRDLYATNQLAHFEMHLPSLEEVFIQIIKDRP